MHQIANVAFLETNVIVADDNPLTQHGKKAQGTLWDQERDEIAIRIVLEEGKLNLLLRLLHQYKIIERGSQWEDMIRTAQSTLASQVRPPNVEPLSVEALYDRCRIFEQSCGLLLRYALAHVEAVQIIDHSELMEHCAQVLESSTLLSAGAMLQVESLSSESSFAAALQSRPAEFDKSQPALCLAYLALMFRVLSDLDEDKLLELCAKHHLVDIVTRFAINNLAWLKPSSVAPPPSSTPVAPNAAGSHLEHVAQFLSQCCQSDLFGTDRHKFLPDKEHQQRLASLRALFVDDLWKSSRVKKSSIQPLLDEIARIERSR